MAASVFLSRPHGHSVCVGNAIAITTITTGGFLLSQGSERAFGPADTSLMRLMPNVSMGKNGGQAPEPGILPTKPHFSLHRQTRKR